MIRHQKKQRGAALLTVLLLTATLSVLMVGMTEVLSRASRHAAVASARDQAFWILYGLEGAALDFLEERASDPDQPVNVLFAQPLVLPTDFGSATISFREASNCFNVNSLVITNDGEEQFDAEAGERFAIMVEALGADLTTGRILAARIADFIDRDDRAEPGSLENYDYERRDVPYRAASRPLRSVSEVRAISGFSPEVYRELAPHLCATQPGQRQELNINTLISEDYPLFAAATRGQVPPRMLQAALRNRSDRGFENVEDFLNRAGLDNSGGDDDEGGPTWFGDDTTRLEMTISVEAPMGRLTMTSMLERRGGGRVQVVERKVGQAS